MINNLLFLLFLFFNYLVSSDISFNKLLYVVENCSGEFRCVATITQATPEHVPSLIECMSKISKTDRKKIVVFPEGLQRTILENDVKEGKLFVALSFNNNVIGYKKLFYPEVDALGSILKHEIRCTGPESKLIDFYSLHQKNGKIVKSLTSFTSWFPHKDPTFCENYPVFYNGTDYVDPDFRGKGVCSRLYELSMQKMLSDYSYLLIKGGYVGLVYGLTQSNDYNADGTGKSRTEAIVQGFLETFSCYMHVYSIFLYRYESYMPQFDEDGQALPDFQSVRGYGNFVLFHLGNEKGHE